MYRIDDPTAAASPPAMPTAGPEGYFTEGNPVAGTPATRITAWFLHMLQEELRAIVTAAGLTPDKANNAQVLAALRTLFGGNVTTITASATLTADHAGLVFVSAAAGGVTLTLPAANAAGGKPLRLVVARTDGAANTVTLQRAGADTLNGLTSGALPVGAAVVLVSDGAGAWSLVAAHGLWQVDTFTASGTAVAPWWARRARARVWGAGGGGGGAAAGGAGSGGGGGGYAEGLYSVTPGASYAVTVGTGGIAGVQNSNNGGAGGTSSFGNLASATGGQGGLSTTTGTKPGVAGGAGSGGIINLTGQSTAASYQIGSTFLASGGGAAPFGGAGTPPTIDGPLAAAFPGGGASGGANGFAGGVGANGLVIVEWLA